MRGLTPSVSRPAYLTDYRLMFCMKYGMAAAEKCPGQEIHGVLHRVTKEELAKLDKIETWYIRDLVELTCYEGRKEKVTGKVMGSVYVLNPELVNNDPDLFNEYPPKERYMDILKEGATKHGVDEAYINDVLGKTEFDPRKSKKDWKTFKKIAKDTNKEYETLPQMNLDDIKKKNNENEDIIFAALNNNVLRLDISEPCTHRGIIQSRDSDQLSYIVAAKWIYDPLYGVPESYEDMGEDQRLAVEDWFIEFFLVGDMVDRWSLVAKLI